MEGSSTNYQAFEKDQVEVLPMEKPEVVKSHLRNTIILPEMVHSMVGLYNGKTFNQMEIKQATTCSSSSIPTSLEIQLTCYQCLGLLLHPPQVPEANKAAGGGKRKQWPIPDGKATNPGSYSVYRTRCHSSSNLVLESRIPRESMLES